MASTTPVEEALLGLGRIQVEILKLAVANPDIADSASILSDAIGKHAAVLRRSHSRTLQAVRGELNE